MLSTRKQKAKERRSRQLDIMSDVESVEKMLGSYSKDDERNNYSEDEMNLDSGSNRPQQSSNLVGDFRSLLNTNSRDTNSLIVKGQKQSLMISSDEIANQVTRKLNNIRTSLNSQVQHVISTAIAEKVLSSI